MALSKSKFEYYSTGASWVEETKWIKFEYVDYLFNARELIVTLSDPGNSRQNDSTAYLPYTYVRLTERLTEQIIFFGRLILIEPKYDETNGQLLVLTCKDLGFELEDTNLEENYSSLATPRISEVIGTHATDNIIEDVVYGGYGATPNIRDAKVEASNGAMSSEGPDYSNIGKPAMSCIQDLARRDQRSDGNYGYVFRVNNGKNVAGNYAEAVYYERGKYIGVKASDDSMHAGSPDTDGLTIAYKETQTVQKLPMFADYSFPSYPKEMYTQVDVAYVDSDNMFHIESVLLTDGLGNNLEDTYNIKRIKSLYDTGCRSQAEAQDVAAAWVDQYDKSTAPNQGTVKVGQYPYYTNTGVDYFVTAGNLVHVHLTDGGALIDAIHNTDMLVAKITYSEPEGVAEIDLVERNYGFTDERYDIFSKIKSQRDAATRGSVTGTSFGDESIPPNALYQATQPYEINLDFTAVDYNTVSWTAGSVKFADGDTLSIDAGNTGNMAATTYLYFITGNSTLQTSTNFLDAISSTRGIVAMCAPAPKSTGKAMVLPGNGKTALLNSVVMTANFIQSEHIDAKQVQFSHMLGKPENLVENGGFEDLDSSNLPRAWSGVDFASTTSHRSGSYAIECNVYSTTKSYYMDYYVPVEEDEIISFAGYADWGNVQPNASARVGIRKYDSSYSDLGNAAYSDTWSDVVDPDWDIQETVSYKVEAGVAYIRFYILIDADATPTGSWRFDDMSGGRASRIIVQGDPAGYRMEIADSGLEAYDNTGSSRVKIDSGAAILKLKDGAIGFYTDAGNLVGIVYTLVGVTDMLRIRTQSGYELELYSVDQDIDFIAGDDIYMEVTDDVIVNADSFNLNTYNTPFILRRFSGNDEPDTTDLRRGELAIWEDGDSNDVWIVYYSDHVGDEIKHEQLT